jgi:hypothetical protein
MTPDFAAKAPVKDARWCPVHGRRPRWAATVWGWLGPRQCRFFDEALGRACQQYLWRKKSEMSS